MPTRRTFIRNGLLFCLGAAGLTCAGEGLALAETRPGSRWGMVVDLARCDGCQACVVACKARNVTADGKFATRVLEAEAGTYPRARIAFTPVLCNQCEEPPCVPACPAGATWRNDAGIVVVDWNRCIGDGACVTACPYGMRFMDPRFGKADKCDFCLDRLAKDLSPACVEACPTGARLFGDFAHPEAELAKYLERGGLLPLRPDLGIRTGVLYRQATTAQGDR